MPAAVALVVAVAVALVVIGVLLEMISGNNGFTRLDHSVAHFVAGHQSPGFTTVLKIVTELGSTRFVTIVVVIVAVQQYRQHRTKALPLFLFVAVTAAVAIDNIVKVLVNRSRPDIARLVGAYGSSFPSGHSAAAAATYASLAVLAGRNRSRRIQLIAAGFAVAIAFAVAASRVLLGIHWLTDVIGGLVLGWGSVALCCLAFGGRVVRFADPLGERHPERPT